MSKDAVDTLGLPQLAILEWLTNRPAVERVFTRHSGLSGITLFEASPTEGGRPRLVRVYPSHHQERRHDDAQMLERLGGRASFEVHHLSRAGFIDVVHPLGNGVDQQEGKRRYQAFVSRFAHDPFHFNDTVHFATPDGAEYMRTTGAVRLAQMRADKLAAEETVRRTVLIGKRVTIMPRLPEDMDRRVPPGVRPTVPHRTVSLPYATATVVRQTGTRFYVRDIRRIQAFERLTTGGSPITGRDPNQYVAIKDILVDHSNQSTVDRLVAVHETFIDDTDRAYARIVEKMLPHLLDLASELAQRETEHLDGVRQALAEHSVAQPADALNDDDEPAAPAPRAV